jgi:transcriptional regulator with XRE-family HTH domain
MGEPSRLAVRVKRLRERKDWTQHELARQSGVSRATIAALEAGQRSSVSLENGARIANALGVTLDALVHLDLLDDAEIVAASARP